MLEDLARIPELLASGWFVTNVLPYWVAAFVFARVMRRL